MMEMAEILTYHNHNRNEVYEVYSVKQIVFYFFKLHNYKNSELINSVLNSFVASAGAFSGGFDFVNNYIEDINNNELEY